MESVSTKQKPYINVSLDLLTLEELNISHGLYKYPRAIEFYDMEY